MIHVVGTPVVLATIIHTEGSSYRKAGAVVHNESRPIVMDLGSLPMYAYHLAPMEKYYPAVGAYRRLPAINMLMTRGCPGKCIFCNSADNRPVDGAVNLKTAFRQFILSKAQ